jgi:hypothetical protein
MRTYDHILRPRTAVYAAVILWAAWRIVAVRALPAVPDPREALILEDVSRIHRGMAPELFHWPGTPWTYVLAVTTYLTNSARQANMLVVCRVMTIPFGALALLAVHGLAARLLRRPFVPVALLAVAPGFASGEANLALVDVPALAVSLLAMRIVVQTPVATRAAYAVAALGGFTAGVAMAFKLPAAVVVPAVAWLALSGLRGTRPRAMALMAVGAGVAAGFVAGCPYVVRDALTPGLGRVFAGLGYELEHYRSGHFGIFATAAAPARAYVTTHGAAAIWCLGIALAVVATPLTIASACAANRRRTPWLWAWAATCLTSILLHRFSFPRHWLMVCPPVCILAAVGFEATRGKWRLIAQAALIVAVAQGAAMCVALSSRESGPSTLATSAAWLRSATAEHDARATFGATEPRLTWVYPRLLDDSRAGLGSPEFAVVTRIEADVQLAAFLHPDSFQEDDFFPLSRDDLLDGAAHLALRDERTHVPVAHFNARDPAWARYSAFLGLRPPFPLNALLHPELTIYAPAGVAKRMASDD